MSISTPADVSYLPMIRSVSRQVAKKAMLDEQSAYDLALAVGEACANAIEHGSSGPRDEIQVVFAWNPEEVRVEVQDSGPGCKVEEVHEPPSKSERGFGIYLMRSLMDNVEFVCEGKGTKVVLVKRIKARNRAICKEGKESRAE